MHLLENISSPADLRRLPPEQLQSVADEIRQYILETMSRVGGHTGASLGAIELAVALHYAFDTPRDRLVWDVGHQAYAHKILTGRRELLPTIKQYGGLSGFLRRDESEYDTFGAGHASTSLSAALGMAIARDKKGEDYHVVALIGDASLAGGMAMEAINQAGHLKSRLIVVLNDNEMSIAPAVGCSSPDSSFAAILRASSSASASWSGSSTVFTAARTTPFECSSMSTVWSCARGM